MSWLVQNKHTGEFISYVLGKRYSKSLTFARPFKYLSGARKLTLYNRNEIEVVDPVDIARDLETENKELRERVRILESKLTKLKCPDIDKKIEKLDSLLEYMEIRSVFGH